MSCVVAEAAAPAPSNQSPRGQKKDLLDALDAAVAFDGFDIGEEERAVTKEQWREQAENSGMFKKAGFRTAFSRGRKERN
jgi:hypothetical protein